MLNILSSAAWVTLATIHLLSLGLVHGYINWREGNWAMSCDFDNNDLTSVQISSELCGGRCAETSGCTHFTWTSYNGGTCWMKKGPVSKDDARETGDQSMVCGVMGEPSPPNPGSGSSGSTTRYWDCCKPSCSWLGKVSGSGSYVKSCRKDGYSAHDNANVASACGDGGEAFTCNNQKPWAVNDQLAYGFAAATIPGLSEQDRCCACYKLDFTSGPVQGKTMIVQVTNSGVDVHPHQFDLQIPGGGVGIYNGCSSQWNAETDGWGQRSGGVTSREQCNTLPEPIRDGCFFRFDWFRGANNPSMTYSRVQCPSELVSVTGCSRPNQ